MSRTVKYLPLTYAAGPWGFVLVLPYMLAVLIVTERIRYNRRRAATASL
jgi:hypothetical protein